MLAIVGQVASNAMNTGAFQELNENPMFADVSVYNRTVMTPQSLPKIIDDAIRTAYKKNGVAVVTIPVDYGYTDIPEDDYSTSKSYRTATVQPHLGDIDEALKLISQAERPVLYIGQGTKGASAEIIKFSEHFSMPIIMSVLAKGIVPDNFPNLLGSAGRLSTKPANEALELTDLIVFIGSDFPFAKYFFKKETKFVQVDIDSSKLGKRHRADAAILGDAKSAMRLMVERGKKVEPSKWFNANLQNRANWLNWIKSFESSEVVPLRPEPVFKEINKIAKENAIFVTDVGNCTIFAARFLNMNGLAQFTTSALFATMGYGVPGGIAAKLSYPQKQVFTLNGDGAFTMSMQDIITQVKYKLAIINIVFSNGSLGFIEAEQEDTLQPKYGIDLLDADFAKASEALGAKGYKVTNIAELTKAFDEAKNAQVPVVIDIKISNARPFPAEKMELDLEKYPAQTVEAFKNRYEVKNMPVLKELLK